MWKQATLAFASTLLAATAAHAVDGVSEINQTCAVNTGCFAGDAAGFPVTIGQTGSYRLTGNLTVPDANTTAIFVTALSTTVDLGGFQILGPVTCTGSGITLSCSPGGTGHGVRFDTTGIHAGTVRNGTIRGMGGVGVSSKADHLQVEDLTLIFNGTGGIVVQDGVHVMRSFAILNDGPGVSGLASSVVSETSSRGNSGRGFFLGAQSRFGKNTSDGNGDIDTCGGGICSELRRFYLTATGFNGALALGACGAGFHMASFHEIYDLASLVYDPVLGQTLEDSGSGPPAFFFFGGWVRTGTMAFGSGPLGTANCDAWTSSSPSDLGAFVWLMDHWETVVDDNGTRPPWQFELNGLMCSANTRVWCIEDR